MFRLSDEILVLESFWTSFGVRYGFGSNLDSDWRRLAPSLIGTQHVIIGPLLITVTENFDEQNVL